MGIIRDSFVVLKNWAQAIEELPEEYQLECYKALMEFGLTGEIPEGISPITKAMMTSFSTSMANNIARYQASVENGKHGGRPRKEVSEEEKGSKNVDNSVENYPKNLEKTQENLEKPSLTQPNLDEPNHNLNDNVNVNVNDISLFNKRACAREATEFWKRKFSEFWRYCPTPSREKLALEVIDTINQSLMCAKEKGELKFNKKSFTFDELFNIFDKLTDEDLSSVVWSLSPGGEEPRNRPYYIFGALLNRAAEK